MFKFEAEVDEQGGWRAKVVVPNGQTVVHSDVSRLLALSLEYFTRSPGDRVFTVGEVAAIEAERALPDGWEATADGHNTNIVDGVTSYSRMYVHTDSEDMCKAPCDAQGNPTPATRQALLTPSLVLAE